MSTCQGSSRQSRLAGADIVEVHRNAIPRAHRTPRAFSRGWERRILAELAYEEPKEDLSVTVLHESGWYLAVLPDGNVLLDNSEEGVTEPRSAMLHEDDLVDALGAVARGDIVEVSTIIERTQASD